MPRSFRVMPMCRTSLRSAPSHDPHARIRSLPAFGKLSFPAAVSHRSRGFLRAFAAVIVVVVSGESASRAGDEFRFEVRETAGIRRRNDVITARLPASTIGDREARFRIVRNGEPIPAQLRFVEQADSSRELVADFIDHFDPFEARQYVLETIEGDTDARVSAEPAGGLELTETPDAYTISSGGVVRWTIRKDLLGLLDFAWKDVDYIADNSAGLFRVSAAGERSTLADNPPDRTVVERAGPIACSVRFEFDDWPAQAGSQVSFEFVRTKSWIHAVWAINRSSNNIGRIGAELNLRLDDAEALVDFGAGDFVYATVSEQQATQLVAGPRETDHIPWQVSHGAREQLRPMVIASREYATPEVHGWAHVMDSRRCTALAIGDFGNESTDSINVDGRGVLTWTRLFPDEQRNPDSRQQLEFWIHFVTMPVHIGARTSPRSMQEPLEVRWLTD